MIPETIELSVVILGNFNPAIFSPSWLKLQNLISDEDFDSAVIEMINPHVSKFNINWLSIEVTNTRCQFKTTDGTAFELLRDLVVNTFKILKETPISAFGINRISDFQVTEDQYDRAGNVLAPFENWIDIFTNPRLLRLEIIQETRDDGEQGSHRIRIMPSNLVKPFGIRIDVNSHFEVKDYANMDKKLDILLKKWDNELKEAENYSEKIFKKIKSSDEKL